MRFMCHNDSVARLVIDLALGIAIATAVAWMVCALVLRAVGA